MKSPNKRRKKRPLLRRRPLRPHPQRLNDSLLSNPLLLKSSQLKMTLRSSSIRRTTLIPITFWINLLPMPMRIWRKSKIMVMMNNPSRPLKTVISQEPRVLQPPNLPRRSSSNTSILKV